MKDIRELMESLERSPRILSEFVKTIPESNLDLRRGRGFWTAAEHVSHLAQVQPMLLKRFECFMDEEHPEFSPYIPGSTNEDTEPPPSMNISSALDRFADYRDRQLVILKGANEFTWNKKATHPEYEAYSFYILARHVLMHDYWHMYRMEELWLTKDAYLTKPE